MAPLLTTDAIVVESYVGPKDERSLADDVLDGLTRPFKELPPKHFYDAYGAELFDRYLRAAGVLPHARRARDPRREQRGASWPPPAPRSSSSSARARPPRRGCCCARWPRRAPCAATSPST